MNISEFKSQFKYLEQLKDDKNQNSDQFRTKEFYSIIPLLLHKYPNAYIRDYIEIDGTFGIVFSEHTDFKLLDALNLYLDLKQVLEETTYLKVKNTGFINMEYSTGVSCYTGFWVLLK